MGCFVCLLFDWCGWLRGLGLLVGVVARLLVLCLYLFFIITRGCWVGLFWVLGLFEFVVVCGGLFFFVLLFGWWVVLMCLLVCVFLGVRVCMFIVLLFLLILLGCW